MRVHSWNPSFTPLQPVGREIEHAITIRSKALDAESPCRSTFMSAISISVGLLIALLAILVFYRVRKLPQIAAYGSQRMCPSCGLITSRLKACCLECGQSLATASVTPILDK